MGFSFLAFCKLLSGILEETCRCEFDGWLSRSRLFVRKATPWVSRPFLSSQ